MISVVFDVETTGLAPCAPTHNTHAWNDCRLVQIALHMYDGPTLVDKWTAIVRPDGWVIANSHIHGITQDMANLQGKDIRGILDDFEAYLDQCDVIVAHNIKFDARVMESEYYRAYRYIPDSLLKTRRYCTMLENMQDGRYVKLPVLHKRLFGQSGYINHRVEDDVSMCAQIYLRNMSQY